MDDNIKAGAASVASMVISLWTQNVSKIKEKTKLKKKRKKKGNLIFWWDFLLLWKERSQE